MDTGQSLDPITFDSVVVVTAPADPSHRLDGTLSPFDPAAATALLRPQTREAGLPPPPPKLGASAMLDAFLRPIGREAFVAEHWERSAVLLREPSRTWPDGMYRLHDLRAGLEAGAYPPRSISLSRAGTLVDTSGLTKVMRRGSVARTVLDPSQVWPVLEEGGSLRVLELQAFDPKAARMSHEIGAALGCRVGVNVYYSAPGHGHFSGMRGGIHWDTHGVFAVQVRGRKRWRVFAPTVEQPLTQHRSFYYDIPEAEPLLDETLEPGDVLYIPRGFTHQVQSPEDSDSLHLAIGVYTPTQAELFDALLARARLDLGHLPRWRRAVDFSSVGERIEAMLEDLCAAVRSLDAEGVLQDAIIESHHLPLFRPRSKPELSLSSPLRRRRRLWFLRREGEHAAVKIASMKLLFPLRAWPALQSIPADETFDLSHLTPHVSADEARVIVEVLLAHGVLEVVQGQGE